MEHQAAHIQHLAFLSQYCSTLTLGPFQKNYGAILGNMLRRMILSHMPGAAITGLKMPQATHEYALLEYMTDDLMVFLQRVKKIALALPPGVMAHTLQLKFQGPGPLTAAHLSTQGVTIANPDLVLTYINQPIELDCSFKIEVGYGYAPLVTQQPRHELVLEESHPSDYLSLHAVFNPIRAVSFTVQKAGDQELIVLNITTNGTIKPEKTVVLAFQYFYPQLELFRALDSSSHVDALHNAQSHVQLHPLEDKQQILNLTHLELSVRAANSLKILNIHTLEELLQHSPAQILKASGVGKKSLQEIMLALERYGLTLKAKQESI